MSKTKSANDDEVESKRAGAKREAHSIDNYESRDDEDVRPKKKESGGARRGSKKQILVAPVKSPVVSKRASDQDDEEEYEEYDDEDDMETLIETLSGKLQFHVFNPDKYEIATHKNIIVVPDDHRKTSERMTEYEWTEVISHRAKQIENGSSVFVNIGDLDDPIKMAEEEIKQKKCPLSIRRMHNDIIAEVWDVNEMDAP